MVVLIRANTYVSSAVLNCLRLSSSEVTLKLKTGNVLGLARRFFNVCKYISKTKNAVWYVIFLYYSLCLVLCNV